MSREIYESAEDRAAEAEIADALGARWGCSMVKLPPLYPVDFAAVKDGRIRGWIEIKKRNISMGQYASIILSLKKLIEAQGLAHCTRIPAIFCVGTDDGIFYAEITTISPDDRIEVGGRTKKTRDEWDVEPVVHIPVERFEPVGEKT